MEMERICHANGVVTYAFDRLAALPVQAHVSTRHGGVSPAPWATLNFSVARGDEPTRVAENRRRFAQAVGVESTQVVSARQVHGTGIAKVDESHRGQTQEGVDGLITDVVGLPLSLVFADCVPLVFYDPARHALGVVHAGWRGTVNGAATAALWAMQAAYGSDPARVLVGIGPSIGPTSYEVGDEVVELAQAKLTDGARYFHRPHEQAARLHFDLWQANVGQLVEAGVLPENIEVSGIDTAQTTGDLFSHRAEHGRCGLFSMLAWLESRA